MKKISNVMIVLAGMLLAGCSTTKEGVSVGNISNTECAMTRSGEPVVQIDKVKNTFILKCKKKKRIRKMKI